MVDLMKPSSTNEMTVNGRHLWHHEFKTTIGDLHIVQHEVKGEMNIIDDYMGWDNIKADAAFHRMGTRMLRDKE